MFNLSWEEFDNNTSNTFKELFKDQHFMNVTLACDDGKKIEAHKVILSTSSTFFKRILTKNPHKHPLIYLKGVKFSELEKIVQFMYQGHTQVRQSDLNVFLSSAKDLEIKGLVDHSFKKEEKACKGADKRLVENLNEIAEDKLEEYVQDSIVGPIEQDAVYNLKTEDVSDDQFRSGERVLNISCDKCEKKFSNRSGLWSHKKNKHEGVFHTCDHCDHKFSHTSNLRRHANAVHSHL